MNARHATDDLQRSSVLNKRFEVRTLHDNVFHKQQCIVQSYKRVQDIIQSPPHPQASLVRKAPKSKEPHAIFPTQSARVFMIHQPQSSRARESTGGTSCPRPPRRCRGGGARSGVDEAVLGGLSWPYPVFVLGNSTATTRQDPVQIRPPHPPAPSSQTSNILTRHFLKNVNFPTGSYPCSRAAPPALAIISARFLSTKPLLAASARWKGSRGLCGDAADGSPCAGKIFLRPSAAGSGFAKRLSRRMCIDGSRTSSLSHQRCGSPFSTPRHPRG